MKNADLFSKRFLSVSLGIASILISGSLLVFSLTNMQRADASVFADKPLTIPAGYAALPANIIAADSTTNMASDDEVRAIHAFGIGIREGSLYFGILYNNNTIGLHKTNADSEDVLLW